jgi:chromosomal replication initiator protein
MELLRTKVNDHVMTTWLEPIVCEEVCNDKIVLSVPNKFFIRWIRDNYLALLKESIEEATGCPYDIDFQSRETDSPPDDVEPPEIQRDRIEEAAGLVGSDALKHNLNPRYTFESFVVGGCNQFAHAAALSISENLAKSYNPFFIYGGVGLGKTHLMSAIGYAVLSRDKTKKVSFSTSEEFTNELINAIRFDRMSHFRNKYRNVDLLMIDDIQFIAGKERTQEEFFHTFNSIYEARKQIVITSDRVPNEISDMEHRLRSRFSWGLVADMGTPDLETKMAILKRKAYEDSIDLPDEVAYFLAEQLDSNIRELVGYLIRVIAMSSLQGIPLSKQLAQTALRDILHRNVKPITVEDIISHVAKAFNVKTVDIKSKKKHKLYSVPRQLGMYLARELTEMSFPGIGAAFGGKDHTTVIYAIKKVEEKIKQDHSMKNLVESLKKNIRE